MTLSQLADKAAVRLYVQARLGPEILPKLYYLTVRPDTIPFDELPNRFVVKPTHGSAWVQIVTDKAALNRAALIDTCNGWLKRSYYRETREWVYKDIEPRSPPGQNRGPRLTWLRLRSFRQGEGAGAGRQLHPHREGGRTKTALSTAPICCCICGKPAVS